MWRDTAKSYCTLSVSFAAGLWPSLSSAATAVCLKKVAAAKVQLPGGSESPSAAPENPFHSATAMHLHYLLAVTVLRFHFACVA